jgi:hypothetical protein
LDSTDIIFSLDFILQINQHHIAASSILSARIVSLAHVLGHVLLRHILLLAHVLRHILLGDVLL